MSPREEDDFPRETGREGVFSSMSVVVRGQPCKSYPESQNIQTAI